MNLGLLVALENADKQTDTHTDRQDSCFISIDIYIILVCIKVSKYVLSMPRLAVEVGLLHNNVPDWLVYKLECHKMQTLGVPSADI